MEAESTHGTGSGSPPKLGKFSFTYAKRPLRGARNSALLTVPEPSVSHLGHIPSISLSNRL